MLQVKYGPYQPALERAFIERVREIKKGDPMAPVLVVSPSRRIADRLQRLLALEADLPSLSVFFHTFYSLALNVAEDAGTLDRTVVGDSLFFDKLIDSLLDASPGLSRIFGGAGRPRGISSAIRASLKDMTDSGVDPDLVLDHLEEGLLGDSEEKERFKHLLLLHREYLKRLQELDLLPPSGLTKLAKEAAADSTFLKGFREILYYGFYDLTGLQADFFEAVTSHHPSVLFFPYRKDHPAFAFAKDFFEQKLHAGGASPESLAAESKTRALGEVLDHLFVPGASAPLPKGSLQVFNASGARDEVWAAAKEIWRLVESGLCRFDEIGLVARTMEPYRAAVSQVFEESGIPYHTLSGEPLLRHPLAKLCLSLLTLKKRDFPALTFLDLLESPYFKGKRRGNWPLLIKKLKIHCGRLHWEGKLSSCLQSGLELYPHLAAEGRKGFFIPPEDVSALWYLIQTLDGELQTPQDSKGWGGMARHAAGLLRHYFDVPEDGLEAESERAIFDKVLESLESLSLFDKLEKQPSWEDFLETVEEKLRRATVSSGSANLGVKVLDAMDARGESFKALFIIGLKEKLFPRQILEEPILRDSIRTALRQVEGNWILPKLSGYEEERLLFYLMASSAEERLYCVYPRSDEEGKAQVPSIYIRELCRACGRDMQDPEFNRHIPRQPFEKIRAAEPAVLSPKELSLRLCDARQDASALYSRLGWNGEGFSFASGRVREMIRGDSPGEMEGVIGPPEEYLKKLKKNWLSAHSLETIGRCPFQFFASRVLGLEETEEPSEKGEISSQVKGIIYHRILKLFYQRLQDSGFWKKKDRAFPEDVLKKAEEEVLKEYGWREMGIYPVLWEVNWENIAAHLRDFLKWDWERLITQGFIPTLLEEEMEGPVPFPVPADMEGLRIKGVLDRVDVSPQGGDFRVVDYKTSWRRGAKLAKAVLKSDRLQPPLYLDLAGRRLPDLKPQGASFYILEESRETTGVDREQDFPAEYWESVKDVVLKNQSALARMIHDGEFFIYPKDGPGGHCNWCAFSSICRKNAPSTRSKSSSGEIYQRFQEIKTASEPEDPKLPS